MGAPAYGRDHVVCYSIEINNRNSFCEIMRIYSLAVMSHEPVVWKE
jgi:hypothetical protein